jgi:ketosteroid isomerase-like protein
MDHMMSSPIRLSRALVGGCLIVLAAGSVAPSLHAQKKHTKPHKESRRADTREIEALEGKWRDAMVQGDSAGLEKLLADDFFGISSNGTVSDKQQYLQRMTHGDNKFTTIELMDLKVRMQATTAIAVSQARVSGALDGRQSSGVFRYTKVYGREGGVWRVLNFEATRVSGPHADDPEMRGGTPISSNAHVR